MTAKATELGNETCWLEARRPSVALSDENIFAELLDTDVEERMCGEDVECRGSRGCLTGFWGVKTAPFIEPSGIHDERSGLHLLRVRVLLYSSCPRGVSASLRSSLAPLHARQT